MLWCYSIMGDRGRFDPSALRKPVASRGRAGAPAACGKPSAGRGLRRHRCGVARDGAAGTGKAAQRRGGMVDGAGRRVIRAAPSHQSKGTLGSAVAGRRERCAFARPCEAGQSALPDGNGARLGAGSCMRGSGSNTTTAGRCAAELSRSLGGNRSGLSAYSRPLGFAFKRTPSAAAPLNSHAAASGLAAIAGERSAVAPPVTGSHPLGRSPGRATPPSAPDPPFSAATPLHGCCCLWFRRLQPLQHPPV